MANSPAGGPETPARPLVLTPTDEWLARISDQLDELNRKVVTVTAKQTGSATKKGAAAGSRRGGTRAEVRGD